MRTGREEYTTAEGDTVEAVEIHLDSGEVLTATVTIDRLDGPGGVTLSLPRRIAAHLWGEVGNALHGGGGLGADPDGAAAALRQLADLKAQIDRVGSDLDEIDTDDLEHATASIVTAARNRLAGTLPTIAAIAADVSRSEG